MFLLTESVWQDCRTVPPREGVELCARDRGAITHDAALKRPVDSAEKVVIPAPAQVMAVDRQNVKLVQAIHAELVLCAQVVVRIPGNPEVFDENSIGQREVRVPESGLPAVHDRSGFFVDERQSVPIQQSRYAVLAP